MAERFGKLFVAIVLGAGLCALGTVWQPRGESWVRSTGAAPRQVRILQFYSTTGSLKAGEKAMLCYSVENARLVRIAPLMETVVPSSNRCLEVVPLHTTHYTILAEGFDGHVATQSLTLLVELTPGAAPQRLNSAGNRGGGSSAYFCNSPRSVRTSWLCGFGFTRV
jgi:hypothetical protein